MLGGGKECEVASGLRYMALRGLPANSLRRLDDVSAASARRRAVVGGQAGFLFVASLTWLYNNFAPLMTCHEEKAMGLDCRAKRSTSHHPPQRTQVHLLHPVAKDPFIPHNLLSLPDRSLAFLSVCLIVSELTSLSPY